MKTRFHPTLILAALLLVPACAKVPAEQVVAARDALTAARDAEADLYVADLYAAVADSFAAAEAEIETQNAKSIFTRSFDRAETLLAYVTENAAVAAGRVAEQKEILRVENEALFAEADAMLLRVNELMAQAPRGKDGMVALASIREDATLTGASVEEARAAQAAGDYLRAGAVAQAALEKAESLVGELQHAIEQTGRRPRS